ncbi:A24 family peptidase [Geminicoccaceae bacterium 1502E]|nr:A24 family peptidase [Geminicoccaceae bacterium 1502E]
MGLCAGSAITSLASRVPEDWRGWLTGRSACPACGARLGPADLVPLASWLALRGRCRHCGTRISPLYPLTEAAALLLPALAFLLLPAPQAWLASAIGWWLLALALVDLRTMLLPDALTLPLLLAGVLLAALGPRLSLPAPVAAADSLIGAAAGFAVFALIALLYRRLRGRDGLGLGDAKLLAAAGAWLGWQALPATVLTAAVAGLCLAVLAGAHRDPSREVPFGPALALAFWIELLVVLAEA